MLASAKNVLFPLAVLAFVAVGITYLNDIFTTTTRWAFLALLAASLLPEQDFLRPFRAPFAPVLFAYFLWCFATSAWSGVPLLSLLKSAALTLTAAALMAGGQTWAANAKSRAAIYFLLPITIVALLSGFLAPGAQPTGSGLIIYQGLAQNPNYLGLVAALGLPFPLYLGFVAKSRGQRIIAALIVVALLFLLWRSGSRASILCGLIIAAIFAMVVSSGRRVSLAIALSVVVAGAVIVAPELEQGVVERVVIKGKAGSDIFLSRRVTWQKSYEAARKGGVLGLGYGVSAGHSVFSFGLTANTYGREKGNAQLAVWEETGLVGLVLYWLLLVGIFGSLWSGLSKLRDREERAEAAVMIGALVGLLAQSCFEAWWTAPGSAESSLFWSTLGVTTGYLQLRTATVDSASRQPAARPFDRVPVPTAQIRWNG